MGICECVSDVFFYYICDETVGNCVFLIKQMTAYELRISDWSSDVCSSDLNNAAAGVVYGKDGKGIWDNDDAVWKTALDVNLMATWRLAELTTDDMQAHGKGSIISVQSCGGFTPIPPAIAYGVSKAALAFLTRSLGKALAPHTRVNALCVGSMSPDGQEAEIHRGLGLAERNRSEEHTSELQSLLRISYAVFCLKKK